MTQYLPKDIGEWMRMVERRLSELARRRSSSGAGGGGDTGWVTPTLASGYVHYSIPLRVRRIGNQTFLDGGVVGNVSNPNPVFVDLDPQFAPSSLQVKAGWFSPPMQSGQVMGYVVDTNGEVSSGLPENGAWYMTGFTWLND